MCKKYKKVGLTLSYLVFLIACVQGQERRMLPVQSGGLWGYIDRTGETRISPRFFAAGEFSDGLAAVSTSQGRCGYINRKGDFAISAKFEFCGSYKEGFAVVRANGTYRFIDKKGRFLGALRFNMAWPFSNGMGRVVVGEYEAAKYGFINRLGQVSITAKFMYAGDFVEQTAVAGIATKGGLKVGFIDRRGKWIIKPKFGFANEFSAGLACVSRSGTAYLFEGVLMWERGIKGKGYYIDKLGRRAFRGDFDQCGTFSEGLAAVEMNGKWSYLDRNGHIVFDTAFSSSTTAGAFSQGLAAINFSGTAKFIDIRGRTVIDTSFDWADDFAGGVARVKNVTTAGAESFGYIDRSGKIIWSER